MPSRNEHGWLTNDAGNIIVYPLVEQHGGVLFEMGCALRFEISTHRETPTVADTTFQVALSVEQAAETVRLLQQMIAQIEAAQGPSH